MKLATIENDFVSLSVDSKGRIKSLKNKLTKTELIKFTDASEAWRLIIPTGKHARDFILGSKQKTPRISVDDGSFVKTITIEYGKITGLNELPLRMKCVFELEQNSKEILAHVEIDNQSSSIVEEVEFPIIGGIGGFKVNGGKDVLDIVAAGDRGKFYSNVLYKGLPDTGRESHPFVRTYETAMFEPDWGGVWVDFYCEKQGLFVGHFRSSQNFVFKVEKFPKEATSPGMHYYPKGTLRWLRIFAVYAPQIKPGERWVSEPIHIMPHEGDWHTGADRYSEYRHLTIKPARQPEWMKDFVGWTEILGKTYLNEVFHDYAYCAEAVVKDKKVTGIDLVFYYGHTKLGAEGADFDNSPDPMLGGEEGFRKMVGKLHKNGVRIILLDHFHRWVNIDVPEYKQLELEKHAVLDEKGNPRTARWWKETFLSCKKLEGPTPEWVEMCPTSQKWLEYYIEHLTKMIELGVDGLELDTFETPPCYSTEHGHKKGEDMFDAKMEFMRKVRAHAKSLNPDFVLIGENMIPETREVLDGFYSSRYLTEVERIYQYLFPEMNHQSVLVGDYVYDQVNKALCLTVGIDTEIVGLRKTAFEACPELAEYIGEVNRFKRRYREIMMHGRFRDTVGAEVKGDCYYSVIEGNDGSSALVLRNQRPEPKTVRANLEKIRECELKIWRPFAKEKRILKMPVDINLKPFEAAVILALRKK